MRQATTHFDVPEFLAALFCPSAPSRPAPGPPRPLPDLSPIVDAWPRRLAALLARIDDADRRQMLRDLFEERAGIFEYDSGLPRDEAERLAYEAVANTLDRESDCT
jgi:hypothetical protein